MGSMKRRLDRLEDERRRKTGNTDEETPPAYDGFFEMEMEWIALHLLRGIEPHFTLDGSGTFVTLDGRLAVGPRRMDIQGLMGPATAAQQEEIANTPERWERFLAEDDEAADLLEGLLEAAESADVPDDYRDPGHEWHDHGEIRDRLGQHEFGSVFVDADERAATRRLTWTLMNDPKARAMLSDLTRRRDAFVADEVDL